MVAAVKERSTVKRAGDYGVIALAAAMKIFQGTIVCRNATGFGAKGITATTLVSVGVAQSTVDNTLGADGAVNLTYGCGLFKFANQAGDLVTAAMVGADCFIVDDQTVAATSGGATRSIAGKIESLDADGGVWVWIGAQFK
jgi:hypothetical protein